MRSINAALTITILLVGLISQAFCGIDYSVSDSGIFWVLGPDGNDIIFRMTLNIGLEETDVLDVNELQVTEELERVDPPDFGDVEKEWTVSYVDGQNNLIGLDGVQRIYTWADADFMMTRYRIMNETGVPILNAYVSFEIVPTLDGPGEYGGETTDYVSEHEIGYMHESGKFFGLKLANMPIYSYRSPGYADFEDAENPETFRYQEMSNASNSDFPLNDDYGFLVFLNTGAHSWGSSDSVEVYVAMGYGVNDSTMTAAILEVQALYDAWLLSSPSAIVDDVPRGIHLGVNRPNPVITSTWIPFTLIDAGSVSLHVTNVWGQRIATICEQSLSAGTYRMLWSGETDRGERAPSGVYYCTLGLRAPSGHWKQSRPLVVAH